MVGVITRGKILSGKRKLWLLLALVAMLPATPAAAAEVPWQIDPRPPVQGYGELSAVDVVPTQIWVGGTEVNAETWKEEPVVRLAGGNILFRIPGPASDPTRDVRLADLAVVGDHVVVVANGGAGHPVVQRYNRISLGESEVLPSPDVGTYGELTAVAPLPDDRALTVGTFGTAPESTQTLVLEENQQGGWRRIPSPNPGTGQNRLNAVTGSGWAAGHYTHRDEPGRSHALVLHDAGPGFGWRQLDVPDAGPYLNELTSVAVTASGDVFVAGWTGADAEHRTAVAMRWNQSTWEVLRPSSTRVTQFNDVTVCPDGTVLFGGYATVGSDETASLEKWAGDVDLVPIPINLPTPDNANNSYPASGVNAIDAGPDGPPFAVGWVRRSDQILLGASLRPASFAT